MKEFGAFWFKNHWQGAPLDKERVYLPAAVHGKLRGEEKGRLQK